MATVSNQKAWEAGKRLSQQGFPPGELYLFWDKTQCFYWATASIGRIRKKWDVLSGLMDKKTTTCVIKVWRAFKCFIVLCMWRRLITCHYSVAAAAAQREAAGNKEWYRDCHSTLHNVAPLPVFQLYCIFLLHLNLLSAAILSIADNIQVGGKSNVRVHQCINKINAACGTLRVLMQNRWILV